MNNKLKTLGAREIKMICEEMSMTKEEVMELDDDGILEVYDVILDIEMEEEMKNSGNLTEKGIIAANILSAIGE